MKLLRHSAICLLLLAMALAAQAKPPFPKVQKLYVKKQYESCLQKISENLGSARGEDLLWLYYMQMSCQQALFYTKRDHGHLKKALQSARRLKQKAKTGIPEYAEDSLSRLRNVVLYQAANTDRLAPKAVKTMEECLPLLTEIYNDARVKWFFFEKYRDSDPEKAESILTEAVTENYSNRKAGDTTDFLHGYLALMQMASSKGALNRGMGIYLRAAEVYPGNKRLCTTAQETLESVLNEFRIGRYDIRETAHRWVDTLKQTGCDNKQLQVHIWREEFEECCDFSHDQTCALNAAGMLTRLSPDTIGTEWFRQRFFRQLSTFSRADSVRMAVWLNLAGIKDPKKVPGTIQSTALELAAGGRIQEAYALQLFMKRAFPKEKTAAEQIRLAINRYLLNESDRSGKPLSLKNILDYYELNSKQADIRAQTVSRLLKLHDLMLINGNYSQCMRITREGLRRFPGDPGLLRAKLQWMKADFEANYRALEDHFEAEISGADIDRCKEGKVTPESQAHFMRVFNCVRRMAGIFDSCILNAEMNARCQKAALIMTANGLLTHGPEKDLKCYSAEGARGAGTSNLSLGHNGVNALFGQLYDAGSGNYFCGHRRWILNPHNAVFGHGSCGNAMALGVFAIAGNQLPGITNEPKPEFVAWPAADYFPAAWMPTRWSFGMSGADFSKARVRMTSNGKPVPLTQNEYVSGYGQNTIVWEPETAKRPNMEWTVYIDNVRIYNHSTGKDEFRNFTYRITAF